jgi:hypothetical protein
MQHQRKHTRASVLIPVTCEVSGSPAFYGAAKDISLRGARIQCGKPPEAGTKVTVVVRLPGEPRQSRLEGTVRWTTARAFGVQFETLGVKDTCAMANLLGRLLRSGKAG